MSPPLLEELSRALRQAERDRLAIAPITQTHPDLTVDDAYQIQFLNTRQRLDEGRTIRGRKVGLTSRAMQQMMGVGEPDFGVLFDDMFVEDGDAIDMSTLVQPRVEAEIAVVLSRDLCGPGVSSTAALSAVDFAFPSLEIIDSRISDWKIGLIDTIADNASSARVVVAGNRIRTDEVDLRLVGMVVHLNGEVVDTGAGAAVLGNPIRCVAWLANKLSEVGEHLKAGEIILTGALHRAVPVKAGDSVVAEFDRLGTIHTRFK